MTGHHQPALVAVSVLVAILASYAALDLSGRVTAAEGAVRRAWLLGGTFAMGVGIWSMHFIAMLAYHLPMAIRYDVPVWLLSVAIALIASALALTVASRPEAKISSLAAAAPLMGLAIAGMHYTGMAAMRVPSEIHYDARLVVLSIIIAIVASFAALWLQLTFRDATTRLATLGKVGAAVAMGLAICGMHYTGMAAVSFHGFIPGVASAGPQLVATRGLAITVTVASCIILVLALAGSRIDRRVRRELASSAESANAVLRAEIGERLEVQARLRESEESYRSLFNSLTELVYVLDMDGRFLDVNDAVESAYGYSRDEVMGQTPALLSDPERVNAERTMEHLRAAAAGEAQQFESWGRARDGRTFPLDVVLSPATYFGERAVLAAARDITDRKRAETELAAAEAHYRRLVEASPYGIFTCDPDGSLLEVNPAADELFCSQDVIGRPFAQLLEPADRAVFHAALAGLREDAPRSAEIELRLCRPTGERRLVALTLTEVPEAGLVPTIHAIARDITVAREQQQQLRRAERLAGVGTLIGGVAHELNNPLTAIKSFAELMLLDPRIGDDREALETMRREADRAARIVSDLRLLARDTQDDGSRLRAVVDVNDVVWHVLKLRRYVHETHNVQVQAELAPNAPRILGDRGQLEQVILNLVVNAGQAMESTSTRKLTIRTGGDGATALLEIVDTGLGISAENMDRVFDPFFTTKAPGEGTGLGLSLVHSIVSDHGGTISVRSEIGVGTAFSLGFPRAADDTAPAPEPAAPVIAAPRRALRVLLVDDEPGIRRAVQHYLRRRGHAVDVAEEGGEALRLIDASAPGQHYHVIVSDLRMPGLSGDDFLAELRDRGTGFDRRVVFISGDGANPQTARMIEASEVPVMYKPFDLSELSVLVEEFAERDSRIALAAPMAAARMG
jgi:PAS domain S-box-containing protein